MFAHCSEMSAGSSRATVMQPRLSPRLEAVVNALPLEPGIRVLEIGCGTGAAARAVAARIGDGHVLAIDRSAKAIEQTRAGSQAEIDAGRLSLRQVAIEDFRLHPGEAPFDIEIGRASCRERV